MLENINKRAKNGEKGIKKNDRKLLLKIIRIYIIIRN